MSALGVVPANDDPPVADDSAPDPGGDRPVHDGAMSAPRTKASFGEGGAIGVVLDDHRAVEALAEQVRHLQAMPRRGHAGRVASAPVARSKGPGAEIAIASGRTPPITLSMRPRSVASGESTGVVIRRVAPMAASRPADAAILVPPMSRSAITSR